jgi:hypothetical protein
MKYLKKFEANYKFKVGDYVRRIFEYIDNKQIFYKIIEIDKYDKKNPYLITDITDKNKWFWVKAIDLIKSNEIEAITNKYNI